MESRPVFADPSGRRHQILRLAGFGFMAAIAACLVAVAVALTGGPQAPFTQWVAPQAPASHNPQQAGTVPLGHATVNGVPGSGNGGGGTGGNGPGQPGPATTSPPSASTSAKPSPTAGATPSATTPTSSASATTPATSPGHGKSSGHGNPHNTASATPTA